MRTVPILLLLACGLAAGDDRAPARGPDIVEVLHRSQQLQLDAMHRSDAKSPRARQIRTSFDALLERLASTPTPALQVVSDRRVVAETVHGRTVVANEALGDLPEGERLFMLAHELGHVALGHWAQVGQLYRKWIPGEVEQQHTDAIARPLALEASALSHRHEYEADAYGLAALRAMGYAETDVLAAFARLGVRTDTATHPGTARRVAALRGAIASGRVLVAVRNADPLRSAR